MVEANADAVLAGSRRHEDARYEVHVSVDGGDDDRRLSIVGHSARAANRLDQPCGEALPCGGFAGRLAHYLVPDDRRIGIGHLGDAGPGFHEHVLRPLVAGLKDPIDGRGNGFIPSCRWSEHDDHRFQSLPLDLGQHLMEMRNHAVGPSAVFSGPVGIVVPIVVLQPDGIGAGRDERVELGGGPALNVETDAAVDRLRAGRRRQRDARNKEQERFS